MSVPGVVYLASWPRSGNTLLRAILWQCFGLESVSIYGDSRMCVRNPLWHTLTGAMRLPSKMKDLQGLVIQQGVAFIKTHNLPPDTIGHDHTIYIIRDGREACVSYWHYLNEIIGTHCTLADVIRGNNPFGSWGAHIQAWAPNTRANTTLLRYENALRERASTIVTLEHMLEISATRFNTMPWREFHNSDPQFFRSGTNNTWKTEMTVDDLALFDELHGDTMQEYGYYPAREPVHA